MSFEQGILQDLADVVSLDRWRAQRSRAFAEDHLCDVPHVGSLLLVRSEILLAAPVIATVSCLANMLEADQGGEQDVRLLAYFEPVLSDSVGQALSDLRRDYRFFSLIQAWRQLDGQLRLAMALTRALSATTDPRSRRPRVDVEAVADSWRRASRLCLDLHAKTDTKLMADGVTAKTSNEQATLALLEDAANGGTGCLDADGLISIPERAERRLSTRVTVSIPVEVVAHNIIIPATIVNASATGLGLKLENPLGAHDPITVRMPDGRNLPGIVVWSRGDRIGMTLTTRLAVDDPVFTN